MLRAGLLAAALVCGLVWYFTPSAFLTVHDVEVGTGLQIPADQLTCLSGCQPEEDLSGGAVCYLVKDDRVGNVVLTPITEQEAPAKVPLEADDDLDFDFYCDLVPPSAAVRFTSLSCQFSQLNPPSVLTRSCQLSFDIIPGSDDKGEGNNAVVCRGRARLIQVGLVVLLGILLALFALELCRQKEKTACQGTEKEVSESYLELVLVQKGLEKVESKAEEVEKKQKMIRSPSKKMKEAVRKTANKKVRIRVEKPVEKRERSKARRYRLEADERRREDFFNLQHSMLKPIIPAGARIKKHNQ